MRDLPGEIERAVKARGWSARQASLHAVGTPELIHDMRRGRVPSVGGPAGASPPGASRERDIIRRPAGPRMAGRAAGARRIGVAIRVPGGNP